MGTGGQVGHIRLEALLGAGGMGEVYRGFDEKLERPVAVKSLRAERRLRPEAKARFLREARLLSRLDHPGICRVFDLVEEEDADHLVLDLNPRLAWAEALQAGLHNLRSRAASTQAGAAEARRLRDEARARALELNPLLEREATALLEGLRS